MPLCIPLEVVHSVQIKSSIEVYSHICGNAFLECVDLLRLPSYTALWVVMIYAGFMVLLACALVSEGISGPWMCNMEGMMARMKMCWLEIPIFCSVVHNDFNN